MQTVRELLTDTMNEMQNQEGNDKYFREILVIKHLIDTSTNKQLNVAIDYEPMEIK